MQQEAPQYDNIAIVAALFEGGLAVFAVALGWLLGYWPLETFSWSWAHAGLGLLATLPLLLILYVSLKWPIGPLARIMAVLDEKVAPMFRQLNVAEFAMISLLAGLGEEMLFRGVIQIALAEWIGGTAGLWLGLAAASVLFGIAHAITPGYAVYATIIGAYLGWIWLSTENLLVPVAAHAVYDFLALVYIVRWRKAAKSSSGKGDDSLDGQKQDDKRLDDQYQAGNGHL